MSPNVYNDAQRAEAYAELEFPGTYYLAYRDLPSVIAHHASGKQALDFGCGAGRSTRFLKRLGFEAVGIDISNSMIELAKKSDPDGTYMLIEGDNLDVLEPRRFDLILSAFAFDNIPGRTQRENLLRSLGNLLTEIGRIVLLGSTPDIYLHELASFTTKDFPENRLAKSGEEVRIVMKDVTDARPVVDQLWHHEDYLKLFEAASLTLIDRQNPLGLPTEDQTWITETTISPWVIYVLGKSHE